MGHRPQKRKIIKENEFKENQIEIGFHAWKRQKERINSNHTVEDIQNCFKNNLVENEFNDYYYIHIINEKGRKDKIACCIVKSRGNIIINTVLGYTSRNPCLNRVDLLVKEHHKYGKINLNLS